MTEMTSADSWDLAISLILRAGLIGVFVGFIAGYSYALHLVAKSSRKSP